MVVVPSALSDMGSTARDQGHTAALCTPSPPAVQRSTVLAAVPNDLEEQCFDDSHLPEAL